MFSFFSLLFTLTRTVCAAMLLRQSWEMAQNSLQIFFPWGDLAALTSRLIILVLWYHRWFPPEIHPRKDVLSVQINFIDPTSEERERTAPCSLRVPFIPKARKYFWIKAFEGVPESSTLKCELAKARSKPLALQAHFPMLNLLDIGPRTSKSEAWKELESLL